MMKQVDGELSVAVPANPWEPTVYTHPTLPDVQVKATPNDWKNPAASKWSALAMERTPRPDAAILPAFAGKSFAGEKGVRAAVVTFFAEMIARRAST